MANKGKKKDNTYKMTDAQDAKVKEILASLNAIECPMERLVQLKNTINNDSIELSLFNQ